MEGYIFSSSEKHHYILATIKRFITIKGIFLWEYEYDRFKDSDYFISISNIEEIDINSDFFFVENNREKDYLVSVGILPDKIFVIFTLLPRFSLFFYLSFRNWFLLNASAAPRLKRFKFRLEIRLLDRFIKYIEKKGSRFVIVGAGEYAEYFRKKVKNSELFIDAYDFDPQSGCKPVQDLLYDAADDVDIYILQLNAVRKTEELLFDIGIKKSQIYVIGDTRNNANSGSAPMDIFDARLGYTRCVEGVPGYVVFESKPAETIRYTIMCLGGSTSDPTSANVKSWSEILFDMLDARGIPVKIWAGGMASYTAEQEMDKLIRDGVCIKPDLVISYSAVNNCLEYYNDSLHPTIRRYQKRLFIKLLESGGFKNSLQKGINIKDVTFGLDNYSSLAVKWMQAETIMSGFCEKFGYAFHCFLQPYNSLGDYRTDKEKITQIKSFYDEARELIKQENGFHDFSSIFANNDFFFDSCHVYEKGNRIIANKMFPIVLKEYEIWRNKK